MAPSRRRGTRRTEPPCAVKAAVNGHHRRSYAYLIWSAVNPAVLRFCMVKQRQYDGRSAPPRMAPLMRTGHLGGGGAVAGPRPGGRPARQGARRPTGRTGTVTQRSWVRPRTTPRRGWRRTGLFRTGVAVWGMSDLRTFFAGTEPWLAESAAHKYGHPERELLRIPVTDEPYRSASCSTPSTANTTPTCPPGSPSSPYGRRGNGASRRAADLRDEGQDFLRPDNRCPVPPGRCGLDGTAPPGVSSGPCAGRRCSGSGWARRR